MLEMRVKGLEDDMKDVKSDMKDVKKDLVDIKVSLAGIHGELKRVPGFVGMGLLIGAIVGLNTIAQIAAKAAGL
ncbi:hypothetical protein [Rhodobacter capsulatus]|nr:hypothetical protein [Rhodobacter capsulatus]MDS0926142.1 hypothetical protein [Rhodobacter capsulatus]